MKKPNPCSKTISGKIIEWLISEIQKASSHQAYKKEEKDPVFVFYVVVIGNFAWWDIQNNFHVLAQAIVQWLLSCPSHFSYRLSGRSSWPVHELISFWFCWLWKISLSTKRQRMIDHRQYCSSSRYMIVYLCISHSQEEEMKILVKVTFPVSSQYYWWQTCVFYLLASTIT